MRNDLDALDIILIFLAGFVFSLVINNFIFPFEVKADSVDSTKMRPNLVRFYNSSGQGRDITPKLKSEYYSASYDIGNSIIYAINFYFAQLSYHSYAPPNRFIWNFNITNAKVSGVSIQNGSGKDIGTCSVSDSSNGSITCEMFNILSASDYNNILKFYVDGFVGVDGSPITLNISNSHIVYGYITDSSIINNQNNNANKINDAIKNQTDQQHKDSQATQDKIQSVDDTLNDGSVDSDAINSIGSNLPETTGPLSAIINLPVRFFQVLLNALNTTTCPVISFTIPWVNKKCTIPCVRNLLQQIGALVFYETIGTIVGAYLLYNYIIYMGKTFQKMSDLEDTSSSTWGGL